MAAIESSETTVVLVGAPGAATAGMIDALRAEGITARAEAGALRAVATFAAQPADLVILGLGHLEDRDLEIIPVLREIRADVHILLSLPEGCRARACRGLSLGADGYVLEPFYLDEMAHIVRRALLRRSPSLARDSAQALSDPTFSRLANALEDAVNNPLQILELLLSAAPGTEIDPGEVRHQTRRIQEVIDELGAFARRRERHPGRARIDRILREALAPRGDQARIEVSDPLPEVSGEPGMLSRAFAALAKLPEVSGGSGHLVVTAYPGPGGRKVLVRLSAPGLLLTDEDLRGIFRPFDSPIPSPLGLKAATARAVIEAQGGTVRASSGPEEGTTVLVELPTASPVKG